jgi:predicted nucleotide-binding protein (sugar kinase/HSP70/actin superfamily)
MYELLPFWHTFFKSLGFNVIVSPSSTRKLYTSGQHTIPSDTACYPAKMVHGHIEALLNENVDAVFYPNMSYNIDEQLGDNHFNCPVVAYYPEVIKANVKALENTKYICDFVGLHNRKHLPVRMGEILEKYFKRFSKSELKKATDLAFTEYENHMNDLRQKGAEFIKIATEKDMPIIVLAGRPYHVDPEINHGIDDLICNLGAVVVTEDSISHNENRFRTTVLNQWTYHSRLYAAAKYVAKQKDLNMNLVQLVSFGCGVDAVTTDETRSIIESGGKIYTQIKIDEITNTGAVKIRLRSLMAVINDKA